MRNRFKQGGMFLTFQAYGADPGSSQNLEGLIDTGFNGYVTLPFDVAFPLGLTLKGSQEYVMANGAISRHFICLGNIVCLDQTLRVPIDVQEKGPVLLGVQLLSKLQQKLTIDFLGETFELEPSPLLKPLGKKRPRLGR